MKWERRKQNKVSGPEPTPGTLPVDFLRLVEETLTSALQEGLTSIRGIHPESSFQASGAIYGDEVLLAITLSHGPSQIAATTVFGSADYDPLAETPALMDVLGACLDAAGSIFHFYLDPAFPERMIQIADASLSALEEAPFEWSPVKSEPHPKITVHVKIDKSNPALDAMTEEWLRNHDPEYPAKQQEAEALLEERLDALQGKKRGSGTPPLH